MKFDMNPRASKRRTNQKALHLLRRQAWLLQAPMLPGSRVLIKDAKYYRERGILAYRSGDL